MEPLDPKQLGFTIWSGVAIAPVSKKLAVKMTVEHEKLLQMTNTYSAQLLLPLSLQWVLYLEQRRYIKKTSVQTKQKYGLIHYLQKKREMHSIVFRKSLIFVLQSISFNSSVVAVSRQIELITVIKQIKGQ